MAGNADRLPDLSALAAFDARLREVASDRAAVERAVDAAAAALAAARRRRDERAEVRLLGYLGNAERLLGRADEAIARLRECLQRATGEAHARARVVARIRLGEALRCADRLDEAESELRRALEDARSQHPSLEDFALQHLGKCLLDSFRLDEAVACLETALRLRVAKGDEELLASTQLALDRARRLRAAPVARPGDAREAGYRAAVEAAWRPDKTQLDATDRTLLADVEAYGWHCLHVHDREHLPCWSFSVGVLRTWQHPELVVFGLRDTAAHDLLEQLVARVKAGETFGPGREYDDVLAGRGCRFVRVDPQWYSAFLGYAQWFYETEDGFPVLQLVWPDEQGRYPWQQGYAATGGSQPVLVSERDAAELGFRERDRGRSEG